VSLHVATQGQGETVLLLHSGGMSSRQWRKLSDRLAASYRVVAPDFLGSGSNPTWPDETPFDLQFDLDAIAPLVEGSFHVVGHSYGGLLALLLASRHHARVKSLAVYDPVAFGNIQAANDEEGLQDLARVVQDPVFLDDARGGRESWLQAFVDYWNGPGSWQAMPLPSREGFLRVGRKVYYEVRSLMNVRSGADAYASIDAPVLLLTGERSPAAARRVVQILAQSLPHSTLHTIAGAGHMGPITHADTVNDLIVEHLDNTRIRRAPR
jgi:pimeloyl-ACP methyl ester carboxylesterase